MSDYRLGDDGQTVYQGDKLVALGTAPHEAAAIVHRLNSPEARQEDVDLLLWLLAEARHAIDWYLAMSKQHLKNSDRLIEERDAALTTAAFWASVNGGDVR